MAALAALLAFAAAVGLYQGWPLHQQLLEKQAANMKFLPMRVDGTMTLTDIRVGFHTWTQIYETTAAVNARSLERGIREHLCSTADSRAMIRDGASFAYEYRTPSKSLIARIEVTACL
jgi:hypothetical protein